MKIAKILSAVVLGLGLASSAHAAQYEQPVGTELGWLLTPGNGRAFEATVGAPDRIDATFNTGSKSNVSGVITFEVMRTFDLVLLSYSGSANQASAYGLTGTVNAGIVPGGAGASFGCPNSFGLGSSNDCRLLGANPNNRNAAVPGETLFSNLAAGKYEFYFFEGSNAPDSGSFQLQVRSMPVPGAGLLFGTALIGGALIRRRTQQKFSV